MSHLKAGRYHMATTDDEIGNVSVPLTSQGGGEFHKRNVMHPQPTATLSLMSPADLANSDTDLGAPESNLILNRELPVQSNPASKPLSNKANNATVNTDSV